jgi:membrane associated rhomboid family serine protease
MSNSSHSGNSRSDKTGPAPEGEGGGGAHSSAHSRTIELDYTTAVDGPGDGSLDHDLERALGAQYLADIPQEYEYEYEPQPRNFMGRLASAQGGASWGQPGHQQQHAQGRHNTHGHTHTPNTGDSDFFLARTLQMMEFEMEDEFLENRLREEREEEGERDFRDKEVSASNCRRQMLTVSTVICLIQIGFFIAMVGQDGIAPQSQNPMVGPPATTLVRYGAKYAGLIVYRNQWWRLVSPIALHAGVIHIVCNVFIQMRVGGYLNLVFGTQKWLAIYIISGIFGELVSCASLPESIGVGSSGAIMGILTAWIVWIVFRWRKIPDYNHKQRNCQLGIVVASVVTTLFMSFAPYVDWGAHLGGAIMGGLLGGALLADQLDNAFNARIVRYGSAMLVVGLFILMFTYVAQLLHPPADLFKYFDSNDDWSKYLK